MTSSVDRRLASVELALRPLEAVVAWLAEAQGFSDIGDYARQIAQLPIEAAPMTVIGRRVDAAIRADLKGRSRQEIEDGVYHATRNAVFLFVLAFQVNNDAWELARHEGLRASAVFYWMGCLLGGPREDDLEPDEWTDHQHELEACWASWLSVVDRLEGGVAATNEARALLAERHYAGRELLFADAAQGWADHVESVGNLRRLADSIAAVWPAAAEKAHALSEAGPTLEERIEDKVSWLTDLAKAKALEMLGDRLRAAEVMEHRLLAQRPED